MGKLDQMSLSCDGVGTKPGETETRTYDFDPLALTNAADVKNKCCAANCYYTIKKRNIACKTGVSRSQWDGHDPFSGGFDKQTDENILKECCRENCYSHYTEKKLTCG